MSAPPTPDDPAPLTLMARTLFHRAEHGTLSTASALHAGWPFGSLAPFAVTRSGDVALALSDLAEHTKNLRADPRASLFVMDDGDPRPDAAQATPRLTILGHVSRPEGDVLRDARARYVARFPEADEYLAKLDFRMYVLTALHVRLVAGFGRVAWLPASAVQEDLTRDPLVPHAAAILAHMNADHADALVLMVRSFHHRPDATAARMVSVDAWGFDVDAGDERFRFDFDA
ncbi:MAG: DUF2470 domain-containing protein, partial [Deltaproteobacteria bacterium]